MELNNDNIRNAADLYICLDLQSTLNMIFHIGILQILS